MVHKLFAALGDPTRMEIWDILSRKQDMPLGEIAKNFALSRQAITRHVDVLCDAELLESEWRGREKRISIKADALDPIEAWITRYDSFWSARLEDLKHEIEKGGQQ